MGLVLNVQSQTAFSTAFGSLSIGPFITTGTITPQVASLNLQSGNNSFTVPASAVGCVIVPPAANAVVLKAKTTSGDVGVNIPQNAPSVLLFDPNNLPATLYINAASGTTGQTQIVFF